MKTLGELADALNELADAERDFEDAKRSMGNGGSQSTMARKRQHAEQCAQRITELREQPL